MLKPQQITNGAEAISPIMEDMEQRVIKALSKEFKRGFKPLESESRSMIINAADAGIDLSNVFEELVKTKVMTTEQVAQVVVSEGLINVYQENQRLAPLGIELKAEELPFLKDLITEYSTLTANDVTRMLDLDAIGFAVMTPNGTRFQNIDTFVKTELESLATSVRAGIYNTDEAVEEFVQNISESGVKTKFPSGYYCDIESAVSMAIITAVNNMAQMQNTRIADELELEYAEVTAHQGARPDHKVWQGKVYKRVGSEPGYPNLEEATGLGTPGGLLGVNCRHQWYGTDKDLPRVYTDEQLENIDPPPREYDGKEFTYYEATQQQRAFERAIRQKKREIAGYEGIGNDDKVSATEQKLLKLEAEYKKFSKAMDLKTHSERTAVYQNTKTRP